MASHLPRRDDNHSVFTSETPHFFKVILQENIQDGILGVPRKFARKYGNQLSSTFKLEVPSGAIWPVELAKTDGRVLLQRGWREFAEYYLLDLGSFVVFRYEGNGHFHVLIFDKTASEIEYPYTSSEDDDDDHTSDDHSTEDLPCPLPPKQMRTDSQYGRGTSSKLENSVSHIKLRSADGVEVTSPRPSATTEVFRCSQQKLTRAEKAHAIQRASAFKSRQNPDFMVVMQPSYLCDRYRMGIPSYFARDFLQMQKCDLTLSNSAGETWPVKYYSNAEDNDQLQPHIRDGWQAFVKDNHLAVCDICIFELIKQQPKILMKVVIIRSAENANKGCKPPAHGTIASRGKTRSSVSDTEPNCQQRRQCPSSSRKMEDPRDSYIDILDDDSPLNQKTKTQRACVGASSLRTSIHSFSVVMQPSHVFSCTPLDIPEEFAKRYLKKNREMMLRVQNGRTWTVEYERIGNNGSRNAVFSGISWRPFAKENELKVGDMCIFELIKEKSNWFDVVIVRKLH